MNVQLRGTGTRSLTSAWPVPGIILTLLYSQMYGYVPVVKYRSNLSIAAPFLVNKLTHR